jgi:hypothetical protein
MEELQINSKIRKEIDALLGLRINYIEGDYKAHEMEYGLLKQLLRLGLVLLRDVFDTKIAAWRGLKLVDDRGVALEKKGDASRQYLSLFGRLDILRPGYRGSSRGSIFYADDALHLPVDTTWSYAVQGLVGESAAENDYSESIRVVNQMLSLNLSGKSSERNIGHLSKWVDEYYEASDSSADATPGSCYCVSFDGKGVPKIKDKPPVRVPEDGVDAAPEPKKRLSAGEKPNVMQMATVAVISSFTAKSRSASAIIKGLLYRPLNKNKDKVEASAKREENDNRWHRGIHRRAFVGDQQKAVDYGMDRIRACIQKHGGRFVVPIDAGIGLEEKVLAYVKNHGLEDYFEGIILDVLHVSEYVWDAATAILGDGSKLRHQWVESMLTDLLEGRTDKVIADLEQVVEKSILSAGSMKQVNKTLGYFKNHQHKMDYKTYLEKGYPISSALVEAACGHLVKDRMEQSGMRWSTSGAQSVLDIRAVKQNGDIERFMEFVIQKEHPVKCKIAA